MRISDWSSDVCSSDLTITHVLVMGNEALQATLGKSGITKYRSKEYDLPAGMRTITAIPTIAHTAVKRNPGQYSGFMSDLKFFAARINGGESDGVKPPKKIRYVLDKQALRALKAAQIGRAACGERGG